MAKPVVTSFEDDHGERCVDILAFPDGTFAFKVFRLDPEDGGRWTCVDARSATRHPSFGDAKSAAAAIADWLN